MRLGGYKKITLQDYPDQVAAICFTVWCQLRCPYCHNAELVLQDKQNLKNNNIKNDELTLEFLSYLEQRKNHLTGVVVTGGEPLMQNDLPDFLRRIKAMGLMVKLDTNGLMPEKLKSLIENKLVDYVALDFKNDRENWAETVGLLGTDKQWLSESYFTNWEESLVLLRESKLPYEIRTTVVKEMHSPEALQQMAQLLSEGKKVGEKWFLQAFAKSGPIMCDFTNYPKSLSAYSAQEMEFILQDLRKVYPEVQIRG